MTGAGPGPWPRRLLKWLLPDDPWCDEFLDQLDEAFRAQPDTGRSVRPALWYLKNGWSRDGVRFVWAMRRRRTIARGDGMGGSGVRQAAGEWIRELRFATRRLLRDRRFTAFVVGTLALGIGANAAVFGVADRLFLSGPDHVDRPEELRRLYLRVDGPTGEVSRTAPWIPYLTAEAIRAASTGFREVALFRRADGLFGTGDDLRPVAISVVGPGFFELLGARPAVGRLPASDREVVVSHGLWTEVWGNDPDVVESTVEVDGESWTVAGVAPPGFSGPLLQVADLWLPLDPAAAGNRNWQVVARLASSGPDSPGEERATQEANSIHQRTDPGRFFGWARDGTIVAAPISADDEGKPSAEAAVARLLVAVAGIVLLIGVANVINLSIARLRRRRREVAIRLALGLGRGGLTRHLASETVVLAGLAALTALPVAALAGSGARRLLLPDFAFGPALLPWKVMVATALATLGAGIAVAVIPIYRARRASLVAGLKATERRSSHASPRLQLVLAALQVTLSASLLLGAGLFMKSFWTLRVTDLGVDADRVVAFTLHGATQAPLTTAEASEWDVYTRALEVIEADPSVEVAAVSLGLPFLYNFGLSIALPGRDSIPVLPGGGPYLSAVTDSYFEATGTHLVEGRGFTAAEVASEDPVVVVSSAMARLLWPGDEALGACLRVGSAEARCSTVIGIAEDVHRVGYREPASMQYYVPLSRESSFGGMAIVANLRSTTPASLDRLRDRLRQDNPEVRYVQARVLSRLLDPQLRPWRLGAWVLGTAALLALIVSVIGVYGVLSYLVEQRRLEMGVRIALGATPGGIRRLVVRQGLTAAGVGLTLGLGLLLGAGRWVEPLLFETSISDPTVLLSVVGLLFASAVAACVLPAHRASRVQPMSCLRDD